VQKLRVLLSLHSKFTALSKTNIWILGSYSGGCEEFYLYDILQCNPLEANRSFGRTNRLYLHFLKIKQARNQNEAGSKQSPDCYLLYAGLLLGLFLDPENGGDMLFRTVGSF
jgi:hypothetical protein